MQIGTETVYQDQLQRKELAVSDVWFGFERGRKGAPSRSRSSQNKHTYPGREAGTK